MAKSRKRRGKRDQLFFAGMPCLENCLEPQKSRANDYSWGYALKGTGGQGCMFLGKEAKHSITMCMEGTR